MKSFKKVLVCLVVALSVVVLSGCGKKGLVGKWTNDYAGYTFTYTFNSDGTGTYDSAGTLMKFTYTTDGDKISILYEGNTVTWDTTYEIKGNELNVKDSNGKDTIYKRK